MPKATKVKTVRYSLKRELDLITLSLSIELFVNYIYI
jgi:hypothetical protein